MSEGKRIKKPTARQKTALVGILQGKSKRQAMLDAGYSDKSSRHPKQKLVASRGFQELISEIDLYSLQKYGLLPETKAGQVIIDAMDAKKIWGTKDDFVETEDHKVRIEAADRVFKLKGLVPEEAGTEIKILIENYAGGTTKIITAKQTKAGA